MHSPLEAKIETLIAPSLQVMGYEVVRVKMMGGESRQTLQIMIDHENGTPIQIEDCEKASYQISAVLDVEDPIRQQYHLEVSSPGVDRPLVRRKDFERYKGYDIKLETLSPEHGRKKFTAVLGEVGDDGVELLIGEHKDLPGQVSIDWQNIAGAKLILTDALLEEHAQHTQ